MRSWKMLFVSWSVTFCNNGMHSLSNSCCYQQYLMQNREGSSWLLLSSEFLWEWGVRSSCLFHTFFKLWDVLALLYPLQSLPICYLWHFCLRLLTTGLVLSHILKTQEKSTVEIVNMVIWRRKVTEQREDMMILKGTLVWLRNKSILPGFFSPT